MHYLKVDWYHKHDDEPVLIYTEMTDSREEVRKVEIYADGRHNYADSTTETGSTRLSITLLPAFEEIAIQSEFNPIVINPNEFEAIWRKAKTQRHFDETY